MRRFVSIFIIAIMLITSVSLYAFADVVPSSQDGKVSVSISGDTAIITITDDNLHPDTPYFWKRSGTLENNETLSYSRWAVDFNIGFTSFTTIVDISGANSDGKDPYYFTTQKVIYGETYIKDAHVYANVKTPSSPDFAYLSCDTKDFVVSGNKLIVTMSANDFEVASQTGSVNNITYFIRHYGPQSETFANQIADSITNFFNSIALFFAKLFA